MSTVIKTAACVHTARDFQLSCPDFVRCFVNPFIHVFHFQLFTTMRLVCESESGSVDRFWIFKRTLCPSKLAISWFTLCCGAGFGGCDWRGVCASDAGAVWPEELADSKWEAAAGRAGGGAGLPGAGPQPC